jgi:hypothetical protein
MKKSSYIFYLSLLFTTGLFAQGRVDGFFKGKGNLDVVLGGGYESNPNYFAGTDKIILQRNVTIYNAFLAYGITDKLDVNISLPYVDVNGVESDFQDYALFLKYKVFEKKGWNISLASGFSSNIIDYQTEGGNAIGQKAKTIDGRLVVHYFASNGIFFTAQGGYSYKKDPVPSSIPLTLKVGLAKAKYYVDVWYDFQHGIGGFDYRGNPSPSTFRTLGVSYHKVGGTFYKPIFKHLGAYLGASYILAGRNISQGLGVNAGIVLKFFKK